MRENIERLKEWVRKADYDLGTTIIIRKYIPEYTDILAFHCHQAVEKYLKCLLEYHSIPFKKSHDLRYLLDLFENIIPITSNKYDKAIKLNSFGVKIRYPDIIIKLNENDCIAAIEITEEFREFLQRNIDFEIDDKEVFRK